MTNPMDWAICFLVRVWTSVPSRVMTPFVCFKVVFMHLSRVVFPHPFCPMMPTTSPFPALKSTSFRTSLEGYENPTPSMFSSILSLPDLLLPRLEDV